MDFYTAISKHYDYIFPFREPQFNFLSKYLNKDRAVLDMACGTGTYAVALAKAGWRVMALDTDPEMVRLAQKKAEAARAQIQIVQGDMRDLKKLYGSQVSFSGAYCIGNSIVHLDSEAEIREVIRQVFELLDDGGSFVVQTVNYDWILNNRVTELPLIEDREQGIKFIRKYAYDQPGEPIEFQVELSYPENGGVQTVANSVKLQPVLSGELKDYLKQAGFRQIDIFGNFQEEPYQPGSAATVIAARK